MVYYTRFLSQYKTMKPCWRNIALGLAIVITAVTAEEKSNTFTNDVRGEEGTIDLIHDFMTAQKANIGSRHDREHIKSGGKIEFGVGPNDQRFFETDTNIKNEVIHSKIPSFISNDLPDPLNPPLREQFLDSNIPNKNDFLNVIPQDPRLYQNNGPYLRNPEELNQYQGLNSISDNYPDFPSQWSRQQGNREYLGNFPNRPQHKVDLNSNTYKNDEILQLKEREKQKERLTATNKQTNRFNNNNIHDDKTSPILDTTSSSDQPQANYRKMDKLAAAAPSHPNSHVVNEHHEGPHITDFTFTAIVAGCTAVAVFGVVGAGMCWYRLHKNQRATADAEYPAYGVTGPSKDMSPGAADRKLAQSAHMYHYQHQKQQMIALDKSAGGERQGSASDVDSDEEGEEGDYTVYECPGLASTGEMEVKNPLFQDEPTPATPARNKDGDRDTPEPQD